MPLSLQPLYNPHNLHITVIKEKVKELLPKLSDESAFYIVYKQKMLVSAKSKTALMASLILKKGVNFLKSGAVV